MKTVVLCGGSGTRLWPLSRTLFPKQFYPLFSGDSLFQRTLRRNAPHSEEFIIVVNEGQFFMAQDQFQELGLKANARFILEPEGRNTAPAIALAALAAETGPILVVPSDHLIQNEKAYATAVNRALSFASEGDLVTFGIKPTHAETGFGYIEAQGDTVRAFREKPDLATAETYVKAGHLWNSGMFCFRAEKYLEELRSHAPAIYSTSLIAFEAARHLVPMRVKAELMRAIPADSIDYAVMEKAKKIKVVPADIGWSDLGSFDSLYEALPKDHDGNTLAEQTAHFGSRGNLVVPHKRFLAMVDVNDLMVVDTPDALLIAHKGSTQKVKDVVTWLKKERPELTHVHTTAHRPWGSYTVLEDEVLFKVKRIVVKPGARLSLQKHSKRSEHWVVVEGKAWVTVGDKTFPLERNQSTYIPIGEQHRLENREAKDLVLIEAQVGDYLGEDDIVRLIDDYQRP